jgi:Protein of unknown function (DUF998)
MTRLMLACGIVGPSLFVVVAMIEGATRPGYSAWRNYVSQLSTGDSGWIQIANFLACGLLTLAFAAGLRRVMPYGRGSVWGPVLLGVFGLGLIVAGVFPSDPILGYPPGTQRTGAQTTQGFLHNIAGLAVFSAVAAACFVLARRFAGDPEWRGWPAYSVASGFVIGVFFVASLAAAALDEQGIVSIGLAGLLQRISIVVGWGWVALLALRLARTANRTS